MQRDDLPIPTMSLPPDWTHETGQRVSDLALPQLGAALRGRGLLLRSGPFACLIRSALPQVLRGVAQAYADYPLLEGSYADFRPQLLSPWWRRGWQAQVVFDADGRQPFLPLPAVQAYALLEWGLNWCISQHANQYLILHAAVLEKQGRALILPGQSGAGKSTLCAALCYAGGWRLLSDELTLLRLADGLVQPLPRPVSLKNASIDIIHALVPDQPMTATVHDTQKGTVAHVRPPADSVARQHEPARPAWVIFPHYLAGASLSCEAVAQAQLAVALAEQSFNYSLHGQAGFNLLADLVDDCAAFHLRYSRLEEGIAFCNRLLGSETAETWAGATT